MNDSFNPKDRNLTYIVKLIDMGLPGTVNYIYSFC
jgi:hypothetical protein